MTYALMNGVFASLPQGLLAFRHELLTGQVDVQPDPSDLECVQYGLRVACGLRVPAQSLRKAPNRNSDYWLL